MFGTDGYSELLGIADGEREAERAKERHEALVDAFKQVMETEPVITVFPPAFAPSEFALVSSVAASSVCTPPITSCSSAIRLVLVG